MQKQFSLHKIYSTNSFGFNPAYYSRFKFGDDIIAEKFGVALAKGFIQKHLSVNPILDQIVIVSSPYAFIPTATFAMKNYFVYELNKWLVENNLAVVEETKIHRTVTYKEDYGELNAEERIKLISNDKFHIDQQFLHNKTIFFLDDIRITGSHEIMIKKMIKDYGLANDFYLLYFAELANQSIHPNIENYLNYYEVKSIFDIDKIIKKSRFTINTRVVKYILNYDSSAFEIFIENQHSAFIHLFYNMAIGNGYHTIEAYQTNLKRLKLQIELMENIRDAAINE